MSVVKMTKSDQPEAARQGIQVRPAFDPDAVNPEIGLSVTQAREELDDAYADMKAFHNLQPDQVFRLVSGHSARLSEIRGRIQRVEVRYPAWQAIRTREVEPALDELAKQFQIASRLLSVQDLDFKMSGGQP